jgi:hypothetical protein
MEDAEYLAVEVVNIPAIGPKLCLSDSSSPFDGCHELVTARERDRPAIDTYLQERIAGREAKLALPTRRVRTLRVEGWRQIHVDDKVRVGLGGRPVSIRVEPAALQVLV